MIFGEHDESTLLQFRRVADRAERAALMADGHLGYIMPIGGVAAYDNQVSVMGVGFDIACGNCALRTDATVSDLGRTPAQRQRTLERLADDIAATISFGVNRSNKADDAPADHALFDSLDWNRLREQAGQGFAQGLKEKARKQLGTVGSGNHYVDVFDDVDEQIWIGVHFGSRGFGHGIASGFLAAGQGRVWGDRIPETETLLSLDSALGQDYWALMELAGRYAYVGREWVSHKVVQLLGARVVDTVHNHHNYAWREERNGGLIVVRKGATPAFPGQRGFVGGSMGDDAVILEGVDTPTATTALYSTVHGAGRIMSRTAARGKTRQRKSWVCRDRDCGGTIPAGGAPFPSCPKCGKATYQRQVTEQITPGRVSETERDAWLKNRGVVVRGGGLDEAPQVYRRLPDVLAAQGDTIRVLHRLRPLVVVMAGADEVDPYKD
jgi:tRNA-splicing ligase RtcB